MEAAELEKLFRERYAAAQRASEQLEGPSLAERFARLPAPERARILDSLSTLDRARLLYAWRWWARPKQLAPPGDWRIWLYLAGRGSGKSRTGAEWIRERLEQGAKSIALIGPTLRDIKRYMLGGRAGKRHNGSGLLDVMPAYGREPGAVWHEVRAEVSFPAYPDAIAYVVTAEEPEFRGANLDTVWCDELAKWAYLETIWHNMEMALRVRGDVPPRIFVSTTPRPLRMLKELVADEDAVVVLGRTDENAANLDHRFVARMAKKYGGTRLGRQETGGEILVDNPDALFSATILDATRVDAVPADLVRVVVAVDPAIATKKNNDATGILVAGIDRREHVYVWADLSGRFGPEEWGRRVVEAYVANRANAVVGERNRGGDLVAANVRAAARELLGHTNVKFVEVHATRGKELRAEPVSAMHEQGRVHVVGQLPELEQELTEWNPRLGGASPNRLDAFVWAVWELARLDGASGAAPDVAGLAAANEELRRSAAAPSLPVLELGGGERAL